MRTTCIKILIIIFFYTPHLLAQTDNQQQRDKIKEIFYQLKNMKQYGYTYTLAAKFPDGSTDQIKGYVFINTDRKIMLTESVGSTTLFSDGWYLNADHKHKNLVIVNTNRPDKKRFKQQAEVFMFGNSEYVNAYIDSAILKKGIIRSFNFSGDTIRCSIGFPPLMEIKGIDLVFDYARKIPVSYNVHLFYAWSVKNKKFKEKGTTKTVTCNYIQDIDNDKYDIHSYFIVSNGKAVLKKYKTYTLKTDL